MLLACRSSARRARLVTPLPHLFQRLMATNVALASLAHSAYAAFGCRRRASRGVLYAATRQSRRVTAVVI